MSGFLFTALSRADVPTAERRPSVVYLDEAHTITSLAVAGVLRDPGPARA